MTALLVTAALAGCAGSDDEPIGVEGEDGAYRFTANVEGDRYGWDFGDRLGRAEGKTAEYTYDFDTGSVTVRLTVEDDGERTEHTRTLVIGEGTNRPPALVLEAQTDWAVVGEEVRFSAAASTDPEGDPLRYTWSCFVKQRGLTVHTDHGHAGGGGVPFATPTSGSGQSRVAPQPLGQPDRRVEGDMCEALQQEGASRDAVVAGSFPQDGLYQIILIGSDGPNPTISTSFDLFVSKPEMRPPPTGQWTFTGNLAGGRGGSLQEACDQLGEACDKAVHPFSLDFYAKNFTADLTATAAAPSTVSLSLFRSGNLFAGPVADSISKDRMDPGKYHVEVIVDEGAQVEYQVDVTVQWDLDPRVYFE